MVCPPPASFKHVADSSSDCIVVDSPEIAREINKITQRIKHKDDFRASDGVGETVNRVLRLMTSVLRLGSFEMSLLLECVERV